MRQALDLLEGAQRSEKASLARRSVVVNNQVKRKQKQEENEENFLSKMFSVFKCGQN